MLVPNVISCSHRHGTFSATQIAAQAVKQKSSALAQYLQDHNQPTRRCSILKRTPARAQSIGLEYEAEKNETFIYTTPSVGMVVNVRLQELLWMVTNRQPRQCFSIMAVTFTAVLPLSLIHI